MSTTYSECPSCSRLFPNDIFSICPKCEIDLNEQVSSGIKQSTEGGNSPIQNGTGNKQTVIINPVPAEDKKTIIVRDKIKPLAMGNVHFKSWWLILSGGIAVTANIITSINGMSSLLKQQEIPSAILPIWVMPVGILLIFIGIMLHRKGYIPILFGHIIERDHSGALYSVKISGTCALCGHKVKAERVGQSIEIVCTNNAAQHRWAFDPTRLGSVTDDYSRS